jgi:DNA repair protein RecO (recombination protein O)
VQFYRHILTDYDRLQFGYFVIKQIARASETVDEPEWYDVLAEVLMALDSTTMPQALTETWFYLHYAELLGHGLNLSLTIDGEKLVADKNYRYDISEQGLRESSNGELTTEHIKLLRLLATRSLKVLSQVGGIAGVLPDCLATARAHAAI